MNRLRLHWKQLRSFDQALIGLFLALNLLILVFHANLSLWGWHLLKHFACILLILVLVPALDAHDGPVPRFIRYWYVPASMPFLYWNMGSYIHLVFRGELDAHIVALETAIFGTLPNASVQQWVSPALTEVMQLFYALFWVTIPAGAALLYFRGRYEECGDFLESVILVFALSNVLFILFPVVGPRFFLANSLSVRYEGLLFAGFLRGFVEEVALRGCAFPSSHVGIGWVVTRFMWATHPWQAKWLFLPALAGLCLATVYGQYHYVTDVAAGLVIGTLIGLRGIRRMRTRISCVTAESI